MSNFMGRTEDDGILIRNNKYAQKFVDFIDEYYETDAKSTKNTYWSIYKSFISPIENVKKKYFYNFNREECVNILESINTNNKRVYKTLKTVMTMYHRWAIDREYNPTRINPMDNVELDDIIMPINIAKMRYISKKDLINKCEKILEAELSTPQYVIIWVLARYGVLNKKMATALTGLKTSDIDFENKKIKFYSDIDNDYRTVDIDDDAIRMLDRAIFGEVLTNHDKIEFAKNSQYVIKSKRANELNEMKTGVINSRISELNGLVRQGYTLSDLQLSCKIDDLIKIKEEKGVLTSDDFKEVQKKYGNSENSYPLLLDDYKLITGDDIERMNVTGSLARVVRRRINGKFVSNKDLGLSPEEMERLYPSLKTNRTARRKIEEKREQSSDDE